MNRYRIGIVGAGFGVRAHLPALKNHPRFDVVALASPRSAASAAGEHGVPHAFESCAEMLAGCELDAVTVASPPFAHHDDVLAVLSARKHVLCEKPFTTRLAAAQTLAEAAHLAETACGVVHEFRFVPEAIALRARRQRSSQVRFATSKSRCCVPRCDGTNAASQLVVRTQRGGGLAGAVLSHLIDHAAWLAGISAGRAVGFHRRANSERTTSKAASNRTLTTPVSRCSNTPTDWWRASAPTPPPPSTPIRAPFTASCEPPWRAARR